MWGHIYVKKKKQRCKMGWLVGPKKQVQMEFETAMWMDSPNFFEEGAEDGLLVGSTSYNECQMGFVYR
jgi:hypothetical protein